MWLRTEGLWTIFKYVGEFENLLLLLMDSVSRCFCKLGFHAMNAPTFFVHTGSVSLEKSWRPRTLSFND